LRIQLKGGSLMAIITISRGTFSGGKSLAECVAEKLGYRCLARAELAEAVERYGVSEEKLSKVIGEAPHLWEHLSSERARYLDCVRAILIDEVKDGDVVYHGIAGHFLLRGAPQVLRVRVVANMEFRIKAAMERGALTREDAIQVIRTMDDKRARWARFLYHVDWSDPSLYDLVLNLDQISLSSACDIVCNSVNLEEYKATPESRKIMDDLVLSSHVRAVIAEHKNISDREIEIEADGGVVTIGGTANSLVDADRVRIIVRKMPGVKEVKSQLRVRIPGVTTTRIDEN
jgi:cytidylate kinase